MGEEGGGFFRFISLICLYHFFSSLFFGVMFLLKCLKNESKKLNKEAVAAEG